MALQVFRNGTFATSGTRPYLRAIYHHGEKKSESFPKIIIYHLWYIDLYMKQSVSYWSYVTNSPIQTGFIGQIMYRGNTVPVTAVTVRPHSRCRFVVYPYPIYWHNEREIMCIAMPDDFGNCSVLRQSLDPILFDSDQ